MSPPEGRHVAHTPPARSERIARIGWATFLALALVLVVGGIYLQPFVAEPDRFPHGVDTSVYIYRSRLVHDVGLNELKPFGERPAHPIVTSVLRDVGGGTPLDLARIWPALFAIAIAAAGAALAAGVAEERRWVAVAVGVAVAASPFVVLTAIGYASNVLLDVFAVAAVALAVRVGMGRKGAAALVLLIGAAAIAHWLFAIGLAAMLAVYGAGVAVFEWRSRRSGGERTQHPARLLVVVALGVLLGALALFVSPERPDRVPSSNQDAAIKIATRLPAMELAVTIPLAAAGAAIMLFSGRRASRRTAVPLTMWALAAPAGLIAWKALDMTIPHRIVPFALGVPALIVLGAGATRLWTDRRATRPGGSSWGIVGAVVSAVLVLAATAWLARAGAETWSEQRAGFTPAQVAQASILADYLETVPPETLVIVPVRPGVWRPLRALQVTLPVQRFLFTKTWRVDFFGETGRFKRRLASKYPAGTIAVQLAGYSDQALLAGHRARPGGLPDRRPKTAGATGGRTDRAGRSRRAGPPDGRLRGDVADRRAGLDPRHDRPSRVRGRLSVAGDRDGRPRDRRSLRRAARDAAGTRGWRHHRTRDRVARVARVRGQLAVRRLERGRRRRALLTRHRRIDGHRPPRTPRRRRAQRSQLRGRGSPPSNARR